MQSSNSRRWQWPDLERANKAFLHAAQLGHSGLSQGSAQPSVSVTVHWPCPIVAGSVSFHAAAGDDPGNGGKELQATVADNRSPSTVLL